MKNDNVNRIDVLRELAPFRGYIPDKYLDKLIEIMSGLPPAMSAVEYARNFGRMCKAHTCRGCAFRKSEEFSMVSCVAFETEYPEEAVAIVEKWAQEHPEGSGE